MNDLNTRPNPYVGPRSFQTGEKLYGRDREIRELLDLLIAERIILLHSPSGAGKSSLIQAGLIPQLENEGFHVLPVVRVNQEPPDSLFQDESFNRYVFSVLLSLEEALPEDARKPLEQLSAMSLNDYLETHPHLTADNDEDEGAETAHDSHVLIFDQFEEVLTIDATNREAKLAFFNQLGEALRERKRWALFSMREDYLAALDPYLRPVPTRLTNTFRLDFLGVNAARQAIQQPVQTSQVSFSHTAVSKLVNDLRQVQIQQPDGSMEVRLGPYVEPVQLQVVCYHLWQQLPSDKMEISAEDISAIGNVDQSLAEYYAEQVAATAVKAGVKERRIREWFERQLITEGGIRGQVLMGAEESEGLDNRAIRMLEDTHLIRAEKRLGATWFELAHDRLIQPVRTNNAAWFVENLSLLERQASLWESQNRPDHLLLRDQALAEAEVWASEHPEDLTVTEHDFLKECRELRAREQAKREQAEQALKLEAAEKVAEAERKRAEEQTRSARKLRQRAILLALFLGLAVVLAGVAAYLGNIARVNAARAQSESTRAVAQQLLAETASTLAVANAGTAQSESTRAVEQQSTAEAASTQAISQEQIASTARALEAEQRATAQSEADLRATAENVALDQRDIALSRQRAALALGYQDTHLDLSLLLSAEAYETADTQEAKSALLSGLQRGLSRKFTPYPIPSDTKGVYSVALSPDGKHLAWGNETGDITVWDYTQNSSQILSGGSSIVRSVSFSPQNGGVLASAGDDANIYFWNVASGQLIGQRVNINKVTALSWSPDGNQIAAAVGPHVVVWDTTNMERIPDSDQVFDRNLNYDINDVAWSPDGKMIAAASSDFSVYVLDPQTGNTTQQFKGHERQVNSVAWSPNSKMLASGDEAGLIYLWNISTFASEILRGHTDSVVSLAFSYDGNLLASAGGENDRSIIVWDVPTRKGFTPLRNNSRTLTDVAFIPRAGETLLASSSRDTTIGLYKVTTDQPLSDLLPTVQGEVTALGVDAGGDILATAYRQNELRLLKIAGDSEQVMKQNLANFRSLLSDAFSPDGKRLAYGATDGTIYVINLETGEEVYSITDAPGPAYSLAYGESYLASSHCAIPLNEDGSCEQSEIRIWDASNGQAVGQPLSAHTDLITSLAISHDDKLLASGSRDQSILIWDLDKGETKGLPLTRHLGAVTSLDFSPDAKTLISGSSDQTMIIWDLEAFQPIGRPLAGFTADVSSLVYSADNQNVFSGSRDGKIMRWDVNYDSWVQRACRSANRSLTQVEWEQFFSGQPYQPICQGSNQVSTTTSTPTPTPTQTP
jgi:WD40 repeat protein